MQMIPADIWDQYAFVLKKRAVPVSRQADYRKWLRYYLDLRGKYPLPASRSEQVRLFIRKLREKRQMKGEKAGSSLPSREGEKEMNGAGGGKEEGAEQRSGRRFNEWRCLKKSESPAWDNIIDNLAAEIKMRQYSPKNTQGIRRLEPQIPELSAKQAS